MSRQAKCTKILTGKSPGFVPFEANLTQLVASSNPTTSVPHPPVARYAAATSGIELCIPECSVKLAQMGMDLCPAGSVCKDNGCAEKCQKTKRGESQS